MYSKFSISIVKMSLEYIKYGEFHIKFCENKCFTRSDLDFLYCHVRIRSISNRIRQNLKKM